MPGRSSMGSRRNSPRSVQAAKKISGCGRWGSRRRSSPAAGKRNYWVNPDLPADPQAWLDGAERVSGSWWPEWSAWLERFSGDTIPAPVRPGSATYQPIEPAPGRYVKERAD